jgi:hypothetical protein
MKALLGPLPLSLTLWVPSACQLALLLCSQKKKAKKEKKILHTGKFDYKNGSYT